MSNQHMGMWSEACPGTCTRAARSLDICKHFDIETLKCSDSSPYYFHYRPATWYPASDILRNADLLLCLVVPCQMEGERSILPNCEYSDTVDALALQVAQALQIGVAEPGGISGRILRYP